MYSLKPQRHRDTEETQGSRPPEETADHADRRRSRPPTPVANTKTRRHKEFTKSSSDEIPWPSNDGQGPLGRAAAPNASVRRGSPAQWPTLSERRSRHLSFLFSKGGEAASRHNEKGARQNRARLTDSTIFPLLLCPFSPLRFLLGRAGGPVSSVSLWFFDHRLPRIA
jgi:hypothetical protein